jgi:hypothetical protein
MQRKTLIRFGFGVSDEETAEDPDVPSTSTQTRKSKRKSVPNKFYGNNFFIFLAILYVFLVMLLLCFWSPSHFFFGGVWFLTFLFFNICRDFFN